MTFRATFLLAIGCCFGSLSALAQPLTALTYNIRFDNPNDGPDRWDLRKKALADEVLRHRPHLIGLQEALIGQLRYLDEQFAGYQRFGVGREDGLEKGEFSPIYFDTSRFRLISGRTFWLSPTPDAPGKGWDAACERVATLLILQEKRRGDSLWVVNTHWDHIGQTARMHSAEMVADILAEATKTGHRAIFMGDLNATPDDAPIVFLQKHLTEACPPEQSAAGTFNGFDPALAVFRRIDYIWRAPRTWPVVSYQVPRPMVNGRHASDHFPVVAQFVE